MMMKALVIVTLVLLLGCKADNSHKDIPFIEEQKKGDAMKSFQPLFTTGEDPVSVMMYPQYLDTEGLDKVTVRPFLKLGAENTFSLLIGNYLKTDKGPISNPPHSILSGSWKLQFKPDGRAYLALNTNVGLLGEVYRTGGTDEEPTGEIRFGQPPACPTSLTRFKNVGLVKWWLPAKQFNEASPLIVTPAKETAPDKKDPAKKEPDAAPTPKGDTDPIPPPRPAPKADPAAEKEPIEYFRKYFSTLHDGKRTYLNHFFQPLIHTTVDIELSFIEDANTYELKIKTISDKTTVDKTSGNWKDLRINGAPRIDLRDNIGFLSFRGEKLELTLTHPKFPAYLRNESFELRWGEEKVIPIKPMEPPK